MKRKQCLLTLMALVLGGCVTSSPVSLPSGAQGLAIECSAPANLADCMNYAAKKCGGPYRIFGQESHSTPTATSPTPDR